MYKKVLIVDSQKSFDTELFAKIVKITIGDEAVKIAKYVLSHPEAIDENIAEDTGINIKTIRSVLFKLNEQNLAFFRRVRNPETGYFIYHWSIDKEKLMLMLDNKRKQIKKLIKERIDYEEENLLYSCGTAECTPLSLDEAYENGFICPNCQEPLDESLNEDVRDFLKIILKNL